MTKFQVNFEKLEKRKKIHWTNLSMQICEPTACEIHVGAHSQCSKRMRCSPNVNKMLSKKNTFFQGAVSQPWVLKQSDKNKMPGKRDSTTLSQILRTVSKKKKAEKMREKQVALTAGDATFVS